MMTDAGRVKLEALRGWRVISRAAECESQTESTFDGSLLRASEAPLTDEELSKPIPYALTLLGAVEAVMWKLECETPADIWIEALPRLRIMLASRFGDELAHKVLD
jgi:hypothetical protein